MRLVGTALICVLAAFGAAFLVGRALNPQSRAGAATTSSTATVAAVPSAPRAPTVTNAALASQFTPGSSFLRKVHHRKRVVHRTPAATPAVVGPATQTAPVAPVSPAPPVTYAPVTPAPAPASSSSGSSKKKSSGGGSGTTIIGG
jgi:hypothetical protein